MIDLGEYKFSAYALMAANAVAIVGVLFWGWSTFEIVAMYWAENVIIGALNVVKMIASRPDESILQADAKGKKPEGMPWLVAGNHAVKVFLVPFFIFHYGMFCLVHGIFVFALLRPGGEFGGPGMDSIPTMIGSLFGEGLGWGLVALAGSHVFSLIVNYFGRGEYRRLSVPHLMFLPYGRIVILHIAIIFGAFLTLALGSPTGVLIMLVVLKTAGDLFFHLAERKRSAKASG